MIRYLDVIFIQGAALRNCSFFIFLSLLSLSTLNACSLAVTRPVQEMSDTAAALKAAKEVSADTLTPEVYRRATEAYFKARNEYRMKNFKVSLDYALKAKKLAETAEFESLRLGATRNSMTHSDENLSPPPPSQYPQPTGTPAFILEEQGGATPSTPTPP